MQLEQLCTVTNLFYMLNIITTEDLYRKALEVAHIPLTQYYDPYLTELTFSIEKEIAKGNYHKTIYHQIMLLDNVEDPFNKLQQAVELLYNNNKKHLKEDLHSFLDNQFNLWNQIYMSIRSVYQSYCENALILSDKEIIETLDRINEESKK